MVDNVGVTAEPANTAIPYSKLDGTILEYYPSHSGI